jgi:hypothetical protein
MFSKHDYYTRQNEMMWSGLDASIRPKDALVLVRLVT